MTLRVRVSVVPYGDESREYVIETLNISNVTWTEGTIEGSDRYIIERNDYKNYDANTPRVHHSRKDGALKLVMKAIKELLNE